MVDAMHLCLDIDNVSANYGARVVLKDVCVRLTQGEVLVVRGANGSGKSTLLRLLCGLQMPAGGSIRYMWQGQQLSPRDAAHIIGWISPDLMLYRELTARENLRFFAALRGVDEYASRIDEVLDLVGLAGRGDDRVAGYSSGMVHRLRYAYALLHRPPVLLLDEPTVMLDVRGTEQVAAIVEAQRKDGMIVIATNDPREQRFADYVLTLETG